SHVIWLTESGYPLAVLIFADVWKTAPFIALLLLVGLQAITEDVYGAAKTGVLKGLRAEKALAAAAAVRHAIRLAVANRVQIAFGTDAGVIPHGSNAHEFQ